MKRPTMVGVCKRTPPCLANMANYVNGSQDEKHTLKFFRQLSTWVCARPQMLQQMEYGKGTYPKGIWLFLVLVFVFAMFCKFKRNLRIKSVKKEIRSSGWTTFDGQPAHEPGSTPTGDAVQATKG